MYHVEWVLMWVYIFFASTSLATSGGSGTQTQLKKARGLAKISNLLFFQKLPSLERVVGTPSQS